MPEKIRRILTVLMALTVVVGLSLHGRGSADADVTMALAAASDMPMSGCDGCGDDQKAMSSTACSAYCSGVVALPSIGAAPEDVSAGSLMTFFTTAAAGHTHPPDPYPPRQTILS